MNSRIYRGILSHWSTGESGARRVFFLAVEGVARGMSPVSGITIYVIIYVNRDIFDAYCHVVTCSLE